MARLTRTALQVNAAVGILCTVAAGAMMSMMLSRPERVAAAVAQQDYAIIVSAVAAELVGWLHALVRFL
jgi:HAMP domain-containing protein